MKKLISSKVKNCISILIPDGESNLVIQVIRCLSDINGVEIILISSNQVSPLKRSRFVKSYIYASPKDPNAWIDIINKVCKDCRIDVIMPIQAAPIRKLIKYRDSLIYKEKILLPPSMEIFDLAVDKIRLAEFMSHLSIPYPKSYRLEKGGGIKIDLERIRYPVLLKPVLGIGGGIGIKRFESADSLAAEIAESRPKEPYYLQEYIQGTDLGMNLLCENGQILAYTIQLGTLFHEENYRPQIGMKMIHNDSVFNKISTLMKALNWSGVAHIDMIFDAKTDEFCVLEMNPRFWLTVQASVPAGINFPWIYCQAILLNEVNRPDYKNTEFLTLQGVIKKIRRNPFTLFRFRYLWVYTPIRSVLRDPVILWYFGFNRILNLLDFRKLMRN